MRGKELPVAFCDCQEQKWLQPRLLVVCGDWGEVLGTEHSSRDEREGPTNRSEKNYQPALPRYHHR